MTSNPSIAEIAAGLTKAQRKALFQSFDDELGGRVLWYDTNRHTAYALHRRNLADDFFRLTKIGLAVRKYLEEQLA